MIKAIFPGSYDPLTYGHLNIIERGARIFDTLDVVIAFNKDKRYWLSSEERLELVTEAVKHLPNVKVCLWDSLVVDFAKEKGINFILRGVRNVNDFSFEFELATMNKQLYPGIETVFLPTDPKFFVLRSSSIKELLTLGGNVSEMIPPHVEKVLRKKITGA